MTNRKTNSKLYFKLMMLTIGMLTNLGGMLYFSFNLIKEIRAIFSVILSNTKSPQLSTYLMVGLWICATVFMYYLMKMILDKLSDTKDELRVNKKVSQMLLEKKLIETEKDIHSGNQAVATDFSIKPNEYNKFAPQKLTADDYIVLDSCIGMETVKEQIRKISATISYEKEFGLMTAKRKSHMVFTGNPGTGKTMVARAIAAQLYKLGAIDEPIFMEVNANHLMGEYVGTTAPTVNAAFEQCKKGVMLIDEAYALVQAGGMYANEAVSTLLTQLESNPFDVTVIFAGYEYETNQFLAMNSGLRSRIPHNIKFADYKPEELLSILEFNLKKMKHEVPITLRNSLLELFDRKIKICQHQNISFSNGRYARNVAAHIHSSHAMNYVKNPKIGTQIIEEDICYEELLKMD